MKRKVLLLIVFTLICPGVLWAEEISLTLDEAISLALRDNRDVLLKVEDVKKAKEKIAEAGAGILPTLNFTGGWTDTRGSLSKDLSQTTTQATLKQYLYKGGKTVNTIQQDKYKLQVSEALLDKTKIETSLNVKKAFYTLLLTSEFYNLNKGILANTKQHLDTLGARYQNGQASKSDILRVQESLSSVEQVSESSLNQVESAQVLLKNLLYLDEEVKIIPNAQFVYEPIDIAYDEAFLKAVETRPEIRQYSAQEQVDKRSIEIAAADNRPSIYASWDYYSRSHVSATTTRDWNDYNVIGLTFSWPIFDGWATKAKVEQAIIDLKETQLLKEKTIRDVASELKNAYLDLKTAIAKIKSIQVQVDLYKDTLSVTEEKYKAGLLSLLDLNDASLGYEVSLFNQRQAIFDYILAKARFEKAMGG